MKAKIISSIGLCMLLVTGCTSNPKSENSLSIYENLDGKETYEKLVEKTNKEVKYIKYVIKGAQQRYLGKGNYQQSELYQLDNGIGIVDKSQEHIEDDKKEIKYSVTTDKERYELSKEEDIYTVSKSSDGITKETGILYNLYTRDVIDMQSIERVDTKEQIILNAKYQVKNETSTGYYKEEFIIGKNGLLQRRSMDAYLDTDYKINMSKTEIDVYCKKESINEDFEKELELIQSLDGASTKEVEEKVAFTTY